MDCYTGRAWCYSMFMANFKRKKMCNPFNESMKRRGPSSNNRAVFRSSVGNELINPTWATNGWLKQVERTGVGQAVKPTDANRD